MRVERIIGFRLVSADPARLAALYRAMGFDIGDPAPISAEEMARLGLEGAGSRIPMTLGPSRVDLEMYDQTGRPYPRDATACDLIFQHLALVTDDTAAAWDRARDAGASPISREGPVTLPESSGGVTAIKFRDPEGHPLEFLQFPRGSKSGWKGNGILGIDHSAISAADVAASRRFYARLGLSDGAATFNAGPAQAALDGLDGVEADVAPMSAGKTPPHLELLGYRNPRGRAHFPLAANDIAATRVVWRADVEALVRDPDGHLHQFSR
jgi:catechol 2,3-dioxygenase-like lactoylglutathione lyase family enzyme